MNEAVNVDASKYAGMSCWRYSQSLNGKEMFKTPPQEIQVRIVSESGRP